MRTCGSRPPPLPACTLCPAPLHPPPSLCPAPLHPSRATLSLNIGDFTRYAKSQRDQVLGQAIGLPLFMALFTFLGLAVTSATVVIYGAPIVDPVQLLGKLEGLGPICLSLFGAGGRPGCGQRGRGQDMFGGGSGGGGVGV